MFKTPLKFAIQHPLIPSSSEGGAFELPIRDGVVAVCIASSGAVWEHVSLRIIETFHPQPLEATPTWDQMEAVKNVFWDAEDCVIQYHPPKSLYVNNHTNVLHLWRKVGFDMPMPDPGLVGFISLSDVKPIQL